MLTDEPFLRSLGTFSVFAVFIVPLTFVLALALALLVNQISFMQAFFRSVFFLPTACSYVVASLVWKLSIFNGVRFGLANTVLGLVRRRADRVDGVDVDPPWYWLVLVTLRLWLQLGFYMILFIAGLQRIPQHLYEAAWIDGATRGWQTLRYITLPQLRTTSVAVLLLLPDRRVPGVRRVLQRARHRPRLPTVRATAAGLPLLHVARVRRAGLRARQRGRGDPDAC